MKALFVSTLGASALVLLPAASAKHFDPGALRVCNASRCVPIMTRQAQPLLGNFYYLGPSPRRARKPPLGAPYYELRFSNGYVTGIVATRQLDRFLSYGVYLERFRRNRWYRVPSQLSAELRRLAAALAPFRLTPAALARSR